jgi:hypothetical protein
MNQLSIVVAWKTAAPTRDGNSQKKLTTMRIEVIAAK